MCHNRTNIHQALRNQLNSPRIRMLHPPHEFDGETFSSSDRSGERCSVIIRDSGKDHLASQANGGERIVDRILCPSRLKGDVEAAPP